MSKNSKRALNVRATIVWKFQWALNVQATNVWKFKRALNVRATNVWKFKRALNVWATNVWKFKRALNVWRQMSENAMGVKCLALNVRATNVWKSKWALNVWRQMSENSHWRQMSLGVKCHMPISRQMSLASIVTTSNRRQRSGLKCLGDKCPRRQTAWILTSCVKS